MISVVALIHPSTANQSPNGVLLGIAIGFFLALVICFRK
jgi:hypothetical protein